MLAQINRGEKERQCSTAKKSWSSCRLTTPSGHYGIALGSRILGIGALQGGMPRYKYISNRFLTAAQNLLLGYKLSEYHTGFRAFSRRVLKSLPLEENSDDFLFDNEM